MNDPQVASSAKESLLLDALLRADGRILGTGRVAEALWNSWHEPEDASGNIKVHVSRLRRKIEPTGLSIETVHGLGYRLALPGAA